MKPLTAERYLVIDLEATCSERGSGPSAVPREEMEIIEIGAVLVAHAGLEIVDEASTFVRPVRHRVLTDFCSRLTTIEQAQVDSAPHFPEALAVICDRLWSERGTLFCSWGNYDRNQFRQDCTYHEIAYPFGEEHLNLKVAFGKRGKRRPWGLGRALESVGLTFEGTPHRGIDDARNIARLLPFIVGEPSG